MRHGATALRYFAGPFRVAMILLFIAPLLTNAQEFVQQGSKLLSSGAVGAPQRGTCVALSSHGNAALVSGLTDNGGTGAMWFYLRTNGTWSQFGTKIVASGALRNGAFGTSIGLSADALTAIAGSVGISTGAWIFTRSGSVWTEQANLIGTGGHTHGLLGAEVALSGDGTTAIISDPSDSLNGAAWIFARNANAWTQQGPKLVSDSGSFGLGLALSYYGNAALVSGQEYGIFPGGSKPGWRRVFRVFTRSNGVWTQQGPKVALGWNETYTASNAVSLSWDGNTAVIGDPSDSNGIGAAYVFTRSGGVWTQQAKLVGTGGAGPVPYQGWSVSIAADSSNKVIVGGLGDTPILSDAVGASWIFSRSGSVWTQVGDKLVGSGAVGAPTQGTSVAFSADGTTAMVGGPYDDYGYGASWVFVPLKVLVTKPSTSETVLAGHPYDITWKAPGATTLRIDFSLDSGRTYQTIADNVPASADHFTWTFADSILSTRCKIKITDTNDSTKTSETGRFRMKGYVITRLKPNGDFEAFNPDLHGWRFLNDSVSMWPESWWRQFDYAGIDPNTGKKYFTPWAFSREYPRPKSDAFIDWPLFVETYLPQNCYKFDGWVSSRALFYWNSHRSIQDGSCTGFAISAFLAFDRPGAFGSMFPSVGSFDSLHQVPLNDGTRKVINQLSWYQYDSLHLRYETERRHKSPRETLQDLKDMLFPGVDDNKFLIIRIKRPAVNHALNGYRLELTDAAAGRYQVDLYDSNFGRYTTVIDSAQNVWGSRSFPDGLYLADSVSTYLTRPTFGSGMPHTPGPSVQPLAKTNLTQASASGLRELYTPPGASVSIADKNGATIGFADSGMVEEMTGALPIVPSTIDFHPPIGFSVPGGNYAVHLAGFPDTSSYLAAFGDSILYSYQRGDAQNNQSDILFLADGLSIANPDPVLKIIGLRAVVSAASLEETFRLENVDIFPGDSLAVRSVAGTDLVFANAGRDKTYDLTLIMVSSNSHGLFNHHTIHLDSNSTHRIVPAWDNLASGPVKILIDRGNHGTFTDSIVVSNETTGLSEPSTTEKPNAFALLQNFPNPFNPSTTIRYQLPVRSNVTLTVFDVLGREVARLVNGVQDAGFKSVQWNASGVASGVYFYRLQAGEFVQTRKTLLMK